MSTCPQVSVIIPVYNVERYLRRCLDSVCNQTLKDLEIIIVNDASPDNSQAIIDEYAARDPRIVCLRHETNRGLGAARNSGIELARGEYLAFVDSDDWIEPEMYETMLRLAEEESVRLVVSGIRVVWSHYNKGRNLFYNGRLKGGTPILSLIEDFWENTSNTAGKLPVPLAISACNKIYHRSLFLATGYRFPEGVYMEDWPASVRLLATLDEILFIPQTFYNYWQTGASTTTGLYNERHIYSYMKVIQDLDQFLKTIPKSDEVREKLINFHVGWAYQTIFRFIADHPNREEFLAHFDKSLLLEMARTPVFIRQGFGELHRLCQQKSSLLLFKLRTADRLRSTYFYRPLRMMYRLGRRMIDPFLSAPVGGR